MLRNRLETPAHRTSPSCSCLCPEHEARHGARWEWVRDVLASCHKAFADLSVNISQKRLNARVSSEGAVL